MFIVSSFINLRAPAERNVPWRFSYMPLLTERNKLIEIYKHLAPPEQRTSNDRNSRFGQNQL